MLRKSAILVFLLILIPPCLAAEFTVLEDVKYVEDKSNDGDSFLVKAGKKEYRLRLYFVDCPETTVGPKSDVQRVREQARYFGLEDPAQMRELGKEAKEFTKGVLSEPFTVHTAFASAGGRSKKGRIYAFVITSTGNDLASVLTVKGYARAHGVGRKTPGGVSKKETEARLRDVEISAMMKRVGIWKKSDPDRIVELRAEQRQEDEKLEKFKDKFRGRGSLGSRIDINKASKEELQFVKGIGPAFAGRIIDGRPYKSVDDLVKVRGIGPKTLEKIRPYLKN